MREPLEAMKDHLVRRYGERGQGAFENLLRWVHGDFPLVDAEVIPPHLHEAQTALVFDAFWQLLPFGTGGRRGQVGYGVNRMNNTTVAMTIQGHCDYLKAAFPGRAEYSVVVANDVRVFNDIAGLYTFLGERHPLLGASSRTFARLACEIYAGNGIVAYLCRPDDPSAVLSTPELSFAIAQIKATGGVNLSASHNPPDDNGIKIYDQYGSQPVAPADQQLLDVVRGVSDIARMPFSEALAAGWIRPLPDDLHDRYMGLYTTLYGRFFAPLPSLPIVYTPLCGCGDTTVGDVMRRLGFSLVIPEDQGPDGRFASIPLRAPNPEVPESTAPARVLADTCGSGVVLSSDPDADRVGLEVKLPDGTWAHMDGNQIAAILAYALMLDPEGPRRQGLVAETLVTTKLLGEVARRRGGCGVVDDLLVGFKYVADLLKALGETGQYRHVKGSPDDLVLAAEESHGVIVVPSIRDKDATGACIFLGGLYQRLRASGRTLMDYYTGILEELGGYATVNRSIMLRGADGLEQKDRIMRTLRQEPPKTLGGQAVRRVVDHWDEGIYGPFLSESDRLPRNLLEFFTDRLVVTVRPSGTEPKLKFYCHLLPGGHAPTETGLRLLQTIQAEADAAAREIYNELLAILGLRLGEAALRLPDIIELGHKLRFDEEIAKELLVQVSDGTLGSASEVLDWLRVRAGGMLAGTDVLPALRGAVGHLVQTWPEPLVSAPLAEELLAWANR